MSYYCLNRTLCIIRNLTLLQTLQRRFILEGTNVGIPLEEFSVGTL